MLGEKLCPPLVRASSGTTILSPSSASPKQPFPPPFQEFHDEIVTGIKKTNITAKPDYDDHDGGILNKYFVVLSSRKPMMVIDNNNNNDNKKSSNNNLRGRIIMNDDDENKNVEDENKRKDNNKDEKKKQPSSPPSSQVLILLLARGRRDLWNGHSVLHRYLAWLLDPLRDFWWDPWLAITAAILPPLAQILHAETIFVYGIRAHLFLLRSLYPVHRNNNNEESRRPPRIGQQQKTYLRQAAAASQEEELALLLTNNRNNRRRLWKPPSDNVSMFRGAVAFSVSMLVDTIGLFMDREKFRHWFQALTKFRGYLEVSGVSQELDEAIRKPLFWGRLLDNCKILNDVQEELYVDRCAKARLVAEQQDDDEAKLLQEPLREGHRMMRFATAAYGTEMIKSALDRDASHEELEDQTKAIAFHCSSERDSSGDDENNKNESNGVINVEDIRILNIADGGDMRTLRHFVAIDRCSQSVVLALRGTLSVSGGLVDLQGMDCDFCGCKAHTGMAEMANAIWTQSGHDILDLFAMEEEFKDYCFTIVGHSLGAGVACLLNIKCHYEQLLGADRTVRCFGFAPPPTFCTSGLSPKDAPRIQKAMDHTLCYIHDNDCVPFLSVQCIRRLALLLDTVDNQTEHLWFYKRFRLFWEWDVIPKEIKDDVTAVDPNKECVGDCDGASKLMIPAKLVVWMKKNFAGSFEAYACDPNRIADLNIFICPDMVSDHLVEPYEDALDDLVKHDNA